MTPDLATFDYNFKISQEHLDMALNQVSLGFWEVNLMEGNLMSCTEQCKLNFGWDTSQNFRYEDMLSRILPEDLPGMQEKVGMAISEQQPYFAQYRVRHPNGSMHWIEAQGKVLFKDDAPYKIIGTTVDITKKKDLEILRDELVSVAMHELKTPLSAVKSSLQVLERHLEKHDEDGVRKIASRALGSAERIHRLLEDISLPALAQSQEIKLTKTVFDLVKLVSEMAANATLLHENHEIKIQSVEKEVLVLADRHRVGQVLTNLINNAVKYAPGERIITVAITSGTDKIAVRVKDNGPGIPESERSKVFQKFYRSRNGSGVEGLGIGLFLCSEIILRHRGTIGVEGNNESGTTIYFSLPI